MAVMLLMFTVLTVTATSRNTTARYENFYGMYELASAGNEQMFFFIEEKFFKHRGEAIVLAEENETSFVNEITKLLRSELDENFELIYFEYHRREWEMFAEFSNLRRRGFHDDFRANTTVHAIPGGGFYIETRIKKYVNNIGGHETRVRSRINFLDDSSVKMVELFRI